MNDRDHFLEDEAPAHPTTPAEYLRLEMARRGLTAITLASSLGVHPQTLYNILGKEPRRISSKLALGLSRTLGRTVDFWLAEKLPLQLVGSVPAETGDEEAAELGHQSGRDEISNWTPQDPPVLQVDWQIRRHLETPGSGLAIKSYDDRCIRSVSLDLATAYVIPHRYDRSLRDKWTIASRKLASATEEELPAILEDSGFKTKYSLEPGASVIVVSREDFMLGANFIARAGQSTGTLLSGLQVLHGLQVDTGYSGPLFMRVLNVTDHSLDISQGDRLASVEIYRLPVEPMEKYQESGESRIARLAEKVFEAVSGLFRFTENAGVTYKATFLGPIDWTYASEDGLVKEKAVDWIKSVLAIPTSIDYADVEADVLGVLDLILISLEEAEALHQHFAIPTKTFEPVARHFADGRKQTLADTIMRLGKRLGDVAIPLIDEAITGRHA